MPWIEINNFTPVSALLSGLMIGLSAALLLFINGRIAGISGIIAGANLKDGLWRVFFIAGMIITGSALPFFLDKPLPAYNNSPLMLVTAGLLVGVGTRIGSGCTSGHAVCGLARLSPRSLVAVMTFMGSAGLTVFIIRHML